MSSLSWICSCRNASSCVDRATGRRDHGARIPRLREGGELGEKGIAFLEVIRAAALRVRIREADRPLLRGVRDKLELLAR